MRRLGLYIALAAMCAPAASHAELKWLATDYDFGTMQEVAGAKTGRVQFVNLGPEPTIINNVRPSCGCTGADYTKGVIEPGDTATVEFTYNPKGRPGRFEKTVKVYTGEANDRTVITIRGTVIGAPQTLKTNYPIEVGPLRLSERVLTTGDIRYGTARHFFLQGYNQSPDTIYPAWNHPSKALSMGISDRAVPPGEGVTFSLYFNSRDTDGPGLNVIPVIITADSAAADKQSIEIELRANVVPDVKGADAASLANAPALEMRPAVVDLGTVSRKGDFEFLLLNTGKSDLHITRISAPEVSMKSWPTFVKAGKQAKVKGKVNLDRIAAGPFAIILDIASDDPVHPLQHMRIAGEKE